MGVGGQGAEVGHAVGHHGGGEGSAGVEAAQGGEAAGARSLHHHAVAVDQSGPGQEGGGRPAVLGVGHPPGTVEEAPEPSPVAGRAPVVDDGHGHPPRRPQLDPGVEAGFGGGRRTAVDEHEQRGRRPGRTLAVGGVGTEEEQGGGNPGDGGEGELVGGRDPVRLEGGGGGPVQLLDGAPRGDRVGHPVDGGGGGDAGPEHHDVVAVAVAVGGRAQGDDGHTGLLDLGQGGGVGIEDAHAVAAAPAETAHETTVAANVEGGLAQVPVGTVELDLVGGQALGRSAGTPPERLPPSEAVGDEPEVRTDPGGLADGFVVPPGHAHGVGEGRTPSVARFGVHQVGHPQSAAVPGHVGVVPGQPGQAAAVGAGPGAGEEVRTGHEDGRLAGGRGGR